MNIKRYKLLATLAGLFLIIISPMSTGVALANPPPADEKNNVDDGQESRSASTPSQQNWGDTAVLRTTTSKEGNTTLTRTTYKNGGKKITRVTVTRDPKNSTDNIIKTVEKKYVKGMTPPYEVTEIVEVIGLVFTLHEKTPRKINKKTTTYTKTKPRRKIKVVIEKSKVKTVTGGAVTVEGTRTTQIKDLKTGKITKTVEKMDPISQQWGPAK